MATVTMRSRIPVTVRPSFPDKGIVFLNWKPVAVQSPDGRAYADDLVVTVVVESEKVRFFFDDTCLHQWHGSTTVVAHHVLAEVALAGTDEEVARVIREPGTADGHDPHLTSLRQKGSALGSRGWSLMLRGYNTFIGHVRAIKGQAWLEEHDTRNQVASFLEELQTRLWVDGEGPLEWQLPIDTYQEVKGHRPGARITVEDWGNLRDQARRRPEGIGTLLANADELCDRGHPRSALVEAVAALEQTLCNLPADQPVKDRWRERFGSRVPSTSLDAHVQNLGVEKTLWYLLPVLYNEEELPDELLSRCRDAVRTRGNVVHNAQRELDDSEVWNQITGLRQLCDLLREYPSSRPGDWAPTEQEGDRLDCP